MNSRVYLGKTAARLDVSLLRFHYKAVDLVNMSMVLDFIRMQQAKTPYCLSE